MNLLASPALACCAAAWLLVSESAPARVLYVDAAGGSEKKDGLTAATAFQTIQNAADLVQAGDEVLVQPGVYFGPVQLKARGTKEKPILFRASSAEKLKVVVTNADAKIRTGQNRWALEDEALGLYSVSFSGEWPARVLYTGTDLFPYTNVERLRTFTADNDKPGPEHGYAFDFAAGKLYVRLRGDGKYGKTDPNQHVMAVAPATGTGFDGTFVTKPQHYCFGVLGAGPAHVVIDGFTFESPGVAGVYVEANDVTVRRCWFLGCRTGVGGNYTDALPPNTAEAEARYHDMRLDPQRQASSAGNIVIEYCDFSQYPTFEDAAEGLDKGLSADSMFLRKAVGKSGGGNAGLPSEHFKYEIGIAARIARNWVIRRNYLHSVLDGIACHAVAASQHLRVEENVFEGVVDNGVETEDHAEDMHISRNAFIDNYMPLSYQPLCGPPFPGPIYITQNVIISTPAYVATWQRTNRLGVFKFHAFYALNWGLYKKDPDFKAREKELVKLPQPVPGGLWVAHNTILFPGGGLAIPPAKMIPNQFYANNIFAADLPSRAVDPSQFKNNAVVPATEGSQGPGQPAAGEGGMLLPGRSALKLGDDLKPAADSPLRGKAVPVSEAGLKLSDIGAVQTGDTWYPLKVGPAACPDRSSK